MAVKDVIAASALNEMPKQPRTDHAADPRAERVKDRDGNRTNFERECFAHSQIAWAGRCRRED
jgi:hypothetical protein